MNTIENRIHNGRGLKSPYNEDLDETEVGWPEMAYEAIRGINHITHGGVIAAPVVYDVLGNLKGVGHLLPQALTQLGEGLERSLKELDVYDNAGDPADNVARARVYLAQAAETAAQLGVILEAAQSAIAAQGYSESREVHRG